MSICSVVDCYGRFVHYYCVCWSVVGFILKLCGFVVCSDFCGEIVVSCVFGVGCSAH